MSTINLLFIAAFINISISSNSAVCTTRVSTVHLDISYFKLSLFKQQSPEIQVVGVADFDAASRNE